MFERSIARRYAKALALLAQEKGQLDAYFACLEECAALRVGTMRVYVVLSNRFMDVSGRLNVASELGRQLGWPKDVVQFLHLLIHKSRIILLPLIVQAYKNFSFLMQGKTEIVLTSARELPASLVNDIVAIFHNHLGRDIVPVLKVDAKTLGGVSVLADGVFIDSTLKNALDKMTSEMSQVVNL